MARVSGVTGIRKSTAAWCTWGGGTIDGNDYQLIKCFMLCSSLLFSRAGGQCQGVVAAHSCTPSPSTFSGTALDVTSNFLVISGRE